MTFPPDATSSLRFALWESRGDRAFIVPLGTIVEIVEEQSPAVALAALAVAQATRVNLQNYGDHDYPSANELVKRAIAPDKLFELIPHIAPVR